MEKTILKRAVITVITCFFVLSGVALGNMTEKSVKKVYSLNDLYKLAETNSESIKIAEESLYITKKDRERAFAVLIPRLTAFGEYSKDVSDTTGAAVFKSDKDTVSYGVRFDQSFTLNGRELIALKINSDQIKRDEFNLEKAREDYFFQVASAYYSVLQAEKLIKIYEVNVKRLLEHKNRVVEKLKLEQVTKTDLFRAEAEYSGAKTDLVRGKNNLQYARALLINLVGLPEDFKLNLTDENKSFTDTLDSLIKESLLKRADYNATKEELKSAEKYIGFSRSSYWPTISVYGTYGVKDVDENKPSEYAYSTDTDAYSVGMSFKFNIFDGGLTSAEVDQAIAQKKMASLKLDAKRKGIILEVKKAYLDLQSQMSILESLRDSLKSSRENFEAVSQHYKYGLKNSIDVMDANSLLIQSERNLANAEFSFELALLNIEYVKGTFLK